MKLNKIYNENCLSGIKSLPDNSIDCCISSPPYWGLRDYGNDGQLGLEPKYEDFIKKLIDIYNEVYRVLKPHGTCFVNLGDTYGGSGKGVGGKSSKEIFNFPTLPKIESNIKDKCLVQIPTRFSLAMTDNDWILRNEIIWHKPNSMPTSASDRFTVDFEKIFFFVKQQKYYFEQQLEPYTEPLDRWVGQMVRGNYKTKTDQSAIQEREGRDMRPNPDGKNMRTVWSINTKPFSDAHFAVYPDVLVSRMIESGCPENGIVLDPFMGAGTTGLVAKKLKRNYIGYEINKEYIKIAERRIFNEIGLFN